MAKVTKAKANDLYTGEKKGLIILVEFPKRTATNTPEVKFSTEKAQEFYNRVANEEGFSDPRQVSQRVYTTISLLRAAESLSSSLML